MKSIILELSANAMDVLAWSVLFNRRFDSKYNKYITAIGFVIVSFLLESLPILFNISFYPVEIIMITCCFLYLLLFRKGKLLHKLFWVTISFVLLFAIAFFAMPIISQITGVDSEIILTAPNTSYRALYLAVVNIIKFTLFFLLSNRKQKIQNNSKAFLCCMIVPIASVISGIWIFSNFASYEFKDLHDSTVMIISGSYLIINIVSLLLYDIMERDAEERLYMAARESHYQIMEQYISQVKETNREIRDWQHDMKQHMNCMKELIERADYIGAGKYLDKLTDNIKASFLKISTGHYVADAVISSKINYASDCNIPFNCEASLPERLPIDEVDLCSLLSNILENAIEACKKVDKPYIKCNIETIKSQLIIDVENSSNGHYKIKDGRFETLKKKGVHGIGIKHIEAIIEKYDGIYTIKPEKSVFKINISIPLKG